MGAPGGKGGFGAMSHRGTFFGVRDINGLRGGVREILTNWGPRQSSVLQKPSRLGLKPMLTD